MLASQSGEWKCRLELAGGGEATATSQLTVALPATVTWAEEYYGTVLLRQVHYPFIIRCGCIYIVSG